jgi:glutamate decarboxylase
LTISYPLPPSCEDTEILRVVVRESLSGDLIRKLISDILEVTEHLLEGDGPSVAMLLAAKRDNSGSGKAKTRAEEQGKGKTADKHSDISDEHKAKIAVSSLVRYGRGDVFVRV